MSYIISGTTHGEIECRIGERWESEMCLVILVGWGTILVWLINVSLCPQAQFDISYTWENYVLYWSSVEWSSWGSQSQNHFCYSKGSLKNFENYFVLIICRFWWWKICSLWPSGTCCDIDLDQHWLRYCIVAWWQLLPEPMLIFLQWGFVVFTSVHFHSKKPMLVFCMVFFA